MLRANKKEIKKAIKRKKLRTHMEWKKTKILNLEYIGR